MFSLQEYATMTYVAGFLQVGKHGIQFSEESCREFLSSHELAHHGKLGMAEIAISKVDVKKLKNSISAKRIKLPLLMIGQCKEGEKVNPSVQCCIPTPFNSKMRGVQKSLHILYIQCCV